MEAKKHRYPRVYKDDGTYHYPKDPDNVIRKKGELYFENWEITGSKESNKGSPKFALTKWIADTFMGDLKACCQEIEQLTGKRVHVRGQCGTMQLPAPHVESALLKLIAESFGEYGWIWTMQPANSPLTNIMDAAIFPALAKLVSSYQGLLCGGRYLHLEMLRNMVFKAWNDYIPWIRRGC